MGRAVRKRPDNGVASNARLMNPPYDDAPPVDLQLSELAQDQIRMANIKLERADESADGTSDQTYDRFDEKRFERTSEDGTAQKQSILDRLSTATVEVSSTDAFAAGRLQQFATQGNHVRDDDKQTRPLSTPAKMLTRGRPVPQRAEFFSRNLGGGTGVVRGIRSDLKKQPVEQMSQASDDTLTTLADEQTVDMNALLATLSKSDEAGSAGPSTQASFPAPPPRVATQNPAQLARGQLAPKRQPQVREPSQLPAPARIFCGMSTVIQSTQDAGPSRPRLSIFKDKRASMSAYDQSLPINMELLLTAGSVVSGTRLSGGLAVHSKSRRDAIDISQATLYLAAVEEIDGLAPQRRDVFAVAKALKVPMKGIDNGSRWLDFELPIPLDMPCSSVNAGKYGGVRFYVVRHVQIKGYTNSLYAYRPIKAYQRVDPASFYEAPSGQLTSGSEMIPEAGNVGLVMRLKRSHFAAGEPCVVELDVDNASRLKVKHIILQIIREVHLNGKFSSEKIVSEEVMTPSGTGQEAHSWLSKISPCTTREVVGQVFAPAGEVSSFGIEPHGHICKDLNVQHFVKATVTLNTSSVFVGKASASARLRIVILPMQSLCPSEYHRERSLPGHAPRWWNLFKHAREEAIEGEEELEERMSVRSRLSRMYPEGRA